MKQILEESGMRFTYDDENCYRIEKSSEVTSLQGVKIVELVEIAGKDKLRMLEAKSSAPNPENKDDFAVYEKDVCEKFQNSISLLNAAKLRRRPEIFRELPERLKTADYGSLHYRMYLVVRKSKEDWIVTLAETFREKLRPFLKCWNIPVDQFLVLNGEVAREKGLLE